MTQGFTLKQPHACKENETSENRPDNKQKWARYFSKDDHDSIKMFLCHLLHVLQLSLTQPRWKIHGLTFDRPLNQNFREKLIVCRNISNSKMCLSIWQLETVKPVLSWNLSIRNEWNNQWFKMVSILNCLCPCLYSHYWITPKGWEVSIFPCFSEVRPVFVAEISIHQWYKASIWWQ